jgi:hypothetical protein
MRFGIPAAVLLALAACIGVLALVPAGGRASGPTWSAAASLETCAPATTPKVVFPFSSPGRRSGEGGIVWLGSSPSCTDSGHGETTFDIAALHSDDTPAPPRALTAGSAAVQSLAAPLYVAATTRGQIVAIAGASTGEATLGDGFATTGIGQLEPLGGSDSLVATMDGFIGDADVATVLQAKGGAGYQIALRAQRHYASSFGRARYLPAGTSRPTALAIGMDFRADRIVVWSQGGDIWAQYVTNDGHVKPRQLLGRSGYDPQIAAVLSDDGRAFVIWTDEPAPGSAGSAIVYVAHSGFGPTFHGATALASFSEPPGVRLTSPAVAAERLSSEGVALLWPTIVGGNYAIDAAGATENGLLAPSVISVPGQDVRLGAVATGPRNEIVVLVEQAPRTATGFDAAHQELLATRSNEVHDPGGLGFGALSEIAPSGPNIAPSVAVDPDTDTAVAAWQTTLFGVPAIQYSIGTAG